MRPRFILVGLDANGTRIIEAQGDPLLTQERAKFLKEFLFNFYNYDASTYAKRTTAAGNFMADELWNEKKKEFEERERRWLRTPFHMEARLLDLREVSDREFEADLAIRTLDRLVAREVKYRVALTIGLRTRSVDNPYAWEVKSYHEDEIR